tara:strand:- start:111 stop:326 length:216 start_codon:yes stop_codon:yes gene_type:complete
MNGKQLTVVILGIIIIGLVLYDIFALTFWGVDTTISVVINEWSFQAPPLLTFSLGMVVGGLVVHFFGWKPK